MCIIVYKPKKVNLPEKNILENCYYNNPDGIGFMVLKDNKVEIYKGFMDFESFYWNLCKINEKENLKEYDVCMHFRIETSGGVRPVLTHPFPVNIEKNKEGYIEDKVGIAHNGVLFSPSEKHLSDTYIFIRDILSNYDFSKKDIREKLKTLEYLISGNKMVIFNSYLNEVYILNESLGEWNKGIWYSNSSYRSYSYKSYSSYSFCDYKNYEEEYEESYKELLIEEIMRKIKVDIRKEDLYMLSISELEELEALSKFIENEEDYKEIIISYL